MKFLDMIADIEDHQMCRHPLEVEGASKFNLIMNDVDEYDKTIKNTVDCDDAEWIHVCLEENQIGKILEVAEKHENLDRALANYDAYVRHLSQYELLNRVILSAEDFVTFSEQLAVLLRQRRNELAKHSPLSVNAVDSLKIKEALNKYKGKDLIEAIKSAEYMHTEYIFKDYVMFLSILLDLELYMFCTSAFITAV